MADIHGAVSIRFMEIMQNLCAERAVATSAEAN